MLLDDQPNFIETENENDKWCLMEVDHSNSNDDEENWPLLEVEDSCDEPDKFNIQQDIDNDDLSDTIDHYDVVYFK